MRGKDIPNLITVMRFLLVPFVVVLLLDAHYAGALVLFAVAGLSDGLDGFLAKRYDWSSRLGSILDPLADKALLVSVYATLAWVGLIPIWLAGLVLGRDAVIVLGAVAYHFSVGRYEMTPTLVSKFTTLFQIVLALVVVSDQAFQVFHPFLKSALVYLVLFTTLLSGFIYVRVWGQRAWAQLRVRRRN